MSVKRLVALFCAMNLLVSCYSSDFRFQEGDLTRQDEKPADEIPADPEEPQEPAEPVEAKFSVIYEKIITPKCLKCHSEGGKAELVPFESYEDIVSEMAELVVPGKGEESQLYKSTQAGAKKFMPPPKSKIKALNVEESKALKEWIDKGALKN